MALTIHWLVDGVQTGADGQPQSTLASNRYRAIVPARALGALGHTVVLHDMAQWRFDASAATRPDAVVLGKLLSGGGPGRAERVARQVASGLMQARAAGCATLADFNDDHFDHTTLGPLWRRLAQSVSACTAGSTPMAALVGRHTAAPVCVVGDPVGSPAGEARAFRREGGLRRLLGGQPRRLSLAWYGNPMNWASLRLWAERLAPLAAQQPWVLWAVTQVSPQLEGEVGVFNNRHGPQTHIELVPWDEETQWSIVRDSDVVLVPSDPASDRHAVKTSNRLVDALHAGRYVVASPLPSYAPFESVCTLTEDPAEGLLWALQHPDDVLARLARARELVSARCSPEAVAREWLAAFDTARAQPAVDAGAPSSPPPADPAMTQPAAMPAPMPTAPAVRPSLLQVHQSQTGKVSDKWAAYFPVYERVFAPLHGLPIRMLEIGVQNGGSLDVWSRWLPAAQTIVGCDIDPKCAALRYDDPRIHVVVGDANQPETQARIEALAPAFDVVIDDGSHLSRDIITSFVRYFPRVAPGGVFVVEDMHAVYRHVDGGGVLSGLSAMAFFKCCAEMPNAEHWDRELRPATLFSTFFPGGLPACLEDGSIESVEFLTSMVVIRKSATRAALGARIVVGSQASVFPGVLRHQARG